MGQNTSGHRLKTLGGDSANSCQEQKDLFDFGIEGSLDSSKKQFQANINALKEKYPMNNGKFGKIGKNCQIIVTDTPQTTGKDFFDQLTKGMKTREIIKGKGWFAKSEDGIYITYRYVTTTPNSPALEINTKGANNPLLRKQKIHFTTKEEWKRNENGKKHH
jgi:hypothetical protein